VALFSLGLGVPFHLIFTLLPKRWFLIASSLLGVAASAKLNNCGTTKLWVRRFGSALLKVSIAVLGFTTGVVTRPSAVALGTYITDDPRFLYVDASKPPDGWAAPTPGFYARFYGGNLVAQLLWWTLLWVGARRPPWWFGDCSAVTLPSWFTRPDEQREAFFKLWRHRRACVAAMPAALLFAYATRNTPAHFCFRFVAAVAVAFYHLLETAATRRHGEYGFLYQAWACLLPERLARAACLGCATHYVLSAGRCKFQNWNDPSTIPAYLEAYRDARSSIARPLSRRLSLFCARRAPANVARGLVDVGEYLGPVAALFTRWKYLMGPMMVAMHIGIFVVMSKQVGLAFITCLPTYAAGFGGGDLVGADAFCLAVLVGLGPTVLPNVDGPARNWARWFRRQPRRFVAPKRCLPDDWPASGITLFALGGVAARRLANRLVTGETRLVLAAEWLAPRDLVGATVAYATKPRPSPPASSRAVVHDAILRTVGFTLFAQDCIYYTVRHPWEPKELILSTETYLRSKRLVEVETGRALRRAFFVRVSKDGSTVKEVLVG